MPIMFKYQSIPGESKVAGYEKYIEVSSFDFGLGRRITAGTESTREGGTASVSEIVLRKKTDNTTVKFFQEACSGMMNKDVEIAFVRTAGTKNDTYLKFELKDTTIAGLNFKSSGGQDARPEETLHLNFNRVEITYTPIGNDFTGSPAGAYWNIGESKGTGPVT